MSASLHNLALVLIVHQVVMVYVGSAFWKLQGPLWKDGTAVYYPLQTEAFSPWGDVLHPLIAWAPFVLGGSYTAVVVQLFFPVLLLYRPTRFLALLIVTGMHVGIGLLMGILYFSLVMIAVDMILISDRSWQTGLSTLRRVTRGTGVTRVFRTRWASRNFQIDSDYCPVKALVGVGAKKSLRGRYGSLSLSRQGDHNHRTSRARGYSRMSRLGQEHDRRRSHDLAGDDRNVLLGERRRTDRRPE